MRISDWSSDVCSSDLTAHPGVASNEPDGVAVAVAGDHRPTALRTALTESPTCEMICFSFSSSTFNSDAQRRNSPGCLMSLRVLSPSARRSEEQTSELQSLMRISYAVFCLKKKIHIHETQRKRMN